MKRARSPVAPKRPHRGRPAKKYSQAHRLLELYDRLHRGQLVRASKAAEDLGVDKRTLQRDFAVLYEVLGLDLERVDDPEPGWRLSRGRKKWGTTRWQVLAVALGARMSGFLSGKRFDAQVKPLLSQLRDSLPSGQSFEVHELEQKLHVVESGQKLYRNNPESLQRLEQMVDALLLELPVAIGYLSRSGSTGVRHEISLGVHALCMTIHRGGVYFVVEVLSGERHVGKRILLALDRVTKSVIDRQADQLPRPKDFRAAEFFETAFGIWTGTEKHCVRLRISPSYATAVQERTWHATQRITRLRDGSLRVEMQLGELHEVSDWILGMGEHCQVEGPPALVKLVQERLRGALALYEKNSSAT